MATATMNVVGYVMNAWSVNAMAPMHGMRYGSRESTRNFSGALVLPASSCRRKSARSPSHASAGNRRPRPSGTCPAQPRRSPTGRSKRGNGTTPEARPSKHLTPDPLIRRWKSGYRRPAMSGRRSGAYLPLSNPARMRDSPAPWRTPAMDAARWVAPAADTPRRHSPPSGRPPSKSRTRRHHSLPRDGRAACAHIVAILASTAAGPESSNACASARRAFARSRRSRRARSSERRRRAEANHRGPPRKAQEKPARRTPRSNFESAGRDGFVGGRSRFQATGSPQNARSMKRKRHGSPTSFITDPRNRRLIAAPAGSPRAFTGSRSE